MLRQCLAVECESPVFDESLRVTSRLRIAGFAAWEDRVESSVLLGLMWYR